MEGGRGGGRKKGERTRIENDLNSHQPAYEEKRKELGKDAEEEGGGRRRGRGEILVRH